MKVSLEIQSLGRWIHCFKGKCLMNSDFPINPEQLRKKLKDWYEKHARALPWRSTAHPYHIWISEIMLQQTTVKAVVPYFERFIQRFPDVSQLSQASEAEVLQFWEGLGYYSRGRNILKTACVIQSLYGGQFPSDIKRLTELPGIGRYTAGAIRSFGFNLPAPIVEANTLRLYARLTGYNADPRTSVGQSYLWSFAEFLQPQRSAGTLNQSLMELGSLICTPNEPNCPQCPLKTLCQAFANGAQNEIPIKKTRPVITPLIEATVAIQHGELYLIRQRTSHERWAGLWDFPRFELKEVSPELNLYSAAFKKLPGLVAREASLATQLNLNTPEFVLQIRHSVTRYRIRLLCYLAELDSIEDTVLLTGFRWVNLAELANLPMPVSGRKYANLLIKSQA